MSGKTAGVFITVINNLALLAQFFRYCYQVNTVSRVIQNSKDYILLP